MVASFAEVIDSDGHIMEQDEEIEPYLPAKYRGARVTTMPFFPTLDGWHRQGGAIARAPARDLPAEQEDNQRLIADPAGWSRFLDEAEISKAVIYPTAALAFGFSKEREWAIDLARAYNDFVYDRYLKHDPRLKAVAILPLQVPTAAATELRRAVTELGMVGGMLPAVGLRYLYGDPIFDPVYEAAQSLDVPLGVHGGARMGLGLDLFEDPDQAFVLAHPYSLMNQFTNMVGERLFDRFPRLKVAYLEGACGWVPYLIERLDRRYERKARHLASEQVRDHPVYFHAELEEKEVLLAALSEVGEDRFIYATDFPHESAATVSHALEVFQTRQDLRPDTKRKILCDNVKAMYGID
jgi:predicted TIM-barrel fold metal-dependent hydrolase